MRPPRGLGPNRADTPSAADRPRGLHPAVRILLAGGLVAPDETASLAVTNLSRSHAVALVEGPRLGRVVVKAPSARSRAEMRSLAAECLVYRMATWCEGLAAAVPRPLLVDEDAQVLVMQGLPTAKPITELTAHGQSITALAASLGSALGGIHRDTTGLGLPPARLAFILESRDMQPAALGLTPAGIAFDAHLRSDAGIAAAIERLRRAWVPRCLVHGDMKLDNCLWGDDTIRIIDWELAGGGEPAWDVGCAIGDFAASDLFDPATMSGAERDDDLLPPQLGKAAASLVRAYVHMAGRGSLTDGFAQQVADALAARLAQMALEYANAGDAASTAIASRIAARATRLALEGPALAQLIEAWCDR